VTEKVETWWKRDMPERHLFKRVEKGKEGGCIKGRPITTRQGRGIRECHKKNALSPIEIKKNPRKKGQWPGKGDPLSKRVRNFRKLFGDGEIEP